MFSRSTYRLPSTPFGSIPGALDPMLNLPPILRYDRAHGGFAGNPDEKAVSGGETGVHEAFQREATMNVTGAEPVGDAGPEPSFADVPASPPGDVNHGSKVRRPNSLSDIPMTRAERLARIRSEIASGVYETPEKLNAAVSRMLDEIG